MKYLAIFFWSADDTSTWSTEVDTLDKKKVIKALLKHGNHESLDDAAIIVVENGDDTAYGPKGESLDRTRQLAPKVAAHWSALNGDFDGINARKLFQRNRK